jgi:hypothetical protein
LPFLFCFCTCVCRRPVNNMIYDNLRIEDKFVFA